MDKLIFAIFTLVFSVCCSTNFNIQVTDYKRESYHSTGMAKVEAKLKDGSTGFVAGTVFAVSKTHLMTAGHFCASIAAMVKVAEEMAFRLSEINNNEELVGLTIPLDSLDIVKIDLKYDLCLLEIKNHGLKPVAISTKQVKIRDKIFTIGAPVGVFPIEAEGYVSVPNIRFEEVDGEKTMASMPAIKGASGSPVYNSDGEVIGIIVAANERYANIAFFTQAKYIRAFLKRSYK
jgi:S1-C subfamily serine protease